MYVVINHQSFGIVDFQCCDNFSGLVKMSTNQSKGFGVNFRLFKKETKILSRMKLGCIHTASSCSNTMAYHVSAGTETSESSLILIRHGESMWNEKNLFTGCVDVPLTSKGVDQAIEAGRRIRNIPVDVIYTSALVRTQMTAMLAMTQHHCKKVPIVLHEESEKAKAWSQISVEEAKQQSIPVITAWQLNERMYGELQGLNKQNTAEKYGIETVRIWRKSYDIRPLDGESLQMCSQRAVTYFVEHIERELDSGKNVMVVAHANSIRAIIMYLEKLTSQQIYDLGISTGIPLLYIYKDGNFRKRGSPIGPTESGVYALTKGLALHRQKLEETL